MSSALHFLFSEAKRTGKPIYQVKAHRPDGVTVTFHRLGGSTIDHSMDGMERAGFGGRVTVKQIDPTSLNQPEHA